MLRFRLAAMAGVILGFLAGSSHGASGLSLKIIPEGPAIHAGDLAKFVVLIENKGEQAVTLVRPGEGSDRKLRTPVVGYSVLPAMDKTSKHPAEPPLHTNRGKCATVNPIVESDLFSLAPGERESLVGANRFEKPGKFRVVLMYQNIPDLEGTADADPKVRAKIRASQPCLLVSNEIIVEVLPPTPDKEIAALFGKSQAQAAPVELQKTYAQFVRETKTDHAASFCLYHAVPISHTARPQETRDRGQDINLPFLKQGFSPQVFVVRKEPDDCYLIRTGTTAIWFVQNKSGDWKIYKYLDKPIE